MLIAIEGIDGAGKHTQTAVLLDHAKSAGLRAVSLSFPRYRETFFGREIGELLKGNFGADNDPRLVGLLFAGDRLQSLPIILEALMANDLVVADRYVGSNLAYQGARTGRHSRKAVIDWLSEVEYGVYGLPRADLNVLLDVPVKLAAHRLADRHMIEGRVHRDLYERDLDFLAQCRDAYAVIASDDPSWHVIPITEGRRMLSPDEVGDRVWKAIVERVTRESASPSLSECLLAARKATSSRR